MFFRTKKTNNSLPVIKVNQHKVLFIHINKTGGTSVFNTLGMSQKIHTTVRHVLDQMSREEFDQHYKLAFVRNPWDKVFSHYKYRVKTNQCNMGKRPITFKDWVKVTYGKEKDFYYFDYGMMFQPQVDWLIDHEGKIALDFIGKFEQINEDFEKIANTLGIPSKLPHLNKTEKANYRDQYDDETRKIVEDWFKKDIDQFGYHF